MTKSMILGGYRQTAKALERHRLQWMDGTARRPGLWLMGHLVDPQRLFADMQRMGVEVREAWQG